MQHLQDTALSQLATITLDNLCCIARVPKRWGCKAMRKIFCLDWLYLDCLASAYCIFQMPPWIILFENWCEIHSTSIWIRYWTLFKTPPLNWSAIRVQWTILKPWAWKFWVKYYPELEETLHSTISFLVLLCEAVFISLL